MRHLAGLLLGAILLTWSSENPAQMVRVERRYAWSAWFRPVALVPGLAYRDEGLPRHTTFCYRAKYATGTQYTPATCATTR